ncbi:oligoendopeptidase F [Pseudoxanthobacter soli DSM 19599]|uniref:Oligoendopeptidase F n=1 Tax=Pseudoxanthobacter soli DSM 19599 TaxID=1123029 RepID=A0A1M7ZRK4_9HYPH|nr:M3 family oligoendopeptidase [Pseudoxanthobacter soli]SHO67515.1 oligoendopeptidase F [Pseudoxanthobacter soli DSM 19599]
MPRLASPGPFPPAAGPAFAPSAATASAAALGDLPEWNLDDLYPGMDSPAVATDLARALEEARAFEAEVKGTLATRLSGPQGGAALAEVIARLEALEELVGRLYSFAGLVYAGDTSDPKRAKFYGDVQEKLTTAGTHLLFFGLELNDLDAAALEAGYAAPALSHYRPWIEDCRREKPYQLEPRIEQLFHEKSVTGHAAWNRLFDETVAGLTVEIATETMTLEQALNRLSDPVPARREAAAVALAEVFKENLRTFTLVMNVLAKDKEISDRWRGFQDVADSRHLANRVEREVVDALVAAVRDAFPRLSHRYYAMKARWLGKEALDHWDRNAPLPEADDRVVPWKDARATVLEAYSRFSPDMAAIADRFFERGWIDAPARPGKSPGAFAHPTVPSAHPYVLLNYQGRVRDVMTLAHELGHGVHQVLAAPNGALMAPTPLTLAETASVFGEMLTFRTLIDRTRTATERKVMLASKVEDMLNTVVRQIAFYTFERRIHLERREGELTAERISDIWLEVQRESLGPAIRLNPGYETFWCYISHFIHAPFYVYAYAFGDCLVNSLYAVYSQAESGFQEKYFALLKAGGTRHHGELLAPFGLDARDPDFWKRGLDVISGMIDELETLD